MPRDVPPLLIVELLFRAKADFADLSHVTTSVSQFLDSSVELPLYKACAFESLRLLDRIRASSKAKTEGTDWSLLGYLRDDRYYRQYPFNRSLQEAVKRKHFDSVKWLSYKFQGYAIVPQVVTTAASVGAIDILEFFHDNDNAALKKKLQSSNPNKRVVAGHRVHWSRAALEVAVLHGHHNVMWWLLQHAPNVRYDKNKALHYAVKNGDIAVAEWLLTHGAALPLLILGHGLVHEVAAQGRLDVLKWLEEKELVSTTRGVVLVAAGKGHLKVVRWLLDLDAGRSANQTHVTGLGGEASLAIHTAAVNGHLEVAKYLRARAQAPASALQRAEEREEQVTQIRRLTTQLGEACTAAKVTIDTLIEAGKNGHAGVVLWLVADYRDVLLQTPSDRAPMDAIAARGHLKVLRAMEVMDVLFCADSRKRNRDGSNKARYQCTSKGLDGAAANGHLDVVKWFGGTTVAYNSSHAIDTAHTGGHLRVVQWLNENYTEIACTSAAMDGVATNGHLDVVKRLHFNTNAGCTTQAMDGAAANGHLDVVKWLHEHRSEVCTVAAMDGAAEHGHLTVVKWLHRNRAEGCTTAAIDKAALQGHFQVVQWLHTHRSEGCTRSAIHSAADRGNFEMLLFLHSQCNQVCTAETVEVAARHKETWIHAWILSTILSCVLLRGGSVVVLSMFQRFI